MSHEAKPTASAIAQLGKTVTLNLVPSASESPPELSEQFFVVEVLKIVQSYLPGMY